MRKKRKRESKQNLIFETEIDCLLEVQSSQEQDDRDLSVLSLHDSSEIKQAEISNENATLPIFLATWKQDEKKESLLEKFSLTAGLIELDFIAEDYSLEITELYNLLKTLLKSYSNLSKEFAEGLLTYLRADYRKTAVKLFEVVNKESNPTALILLEQMIQHKKKHDNLKYRMNLIIKILKNSFDTSNREYVDIEDPFFKGRYYYFIGELEQAFHYFIQAVNHYRLTIQVDEVLLISKKYSIDTPTKIDQEKKYLSIDDQMKLWLYLHFCFVEKQDRIASKCLSTFEALSEVFVTANLSEFIPLKPPIKLLKLHAAESHIERDAAAQKVYMEDVAITLEEISDIERTIGQKNRSIGKKGEKAVFIHLIKHYCAKLRCQELGKAPTLKDIQWRSKTLKVKYIEIYGNKQKDDAKKFQRKFSLFWFNPGESEKCLPYDIALKKTKIDLESKKSYDSELRLIQAKSTHKERISQLSFSQNEWQDIKKSADYKLIIKSIDEVSSTSQKEQEFILYHKDNNWWVSHINSEGEKKQTKMANLRTLDPATTFVSEPFKTSLVKKIKSFLGLSCYKIYTAANIALEKKSSALPIFKKIPIRDLQDPLIYHKIPINQLTIKPFK